MSRNRRAPRRGFTLVEIMVVVFMIGVLLAVAVPNFFRYRELSRTTLCQTNLKSIADAKQRWALEVGAGAGDTPVDSDLFGAGAYIKARVVCPAGGRYEYGTINEDPRCELASEGHVLP
jgi:prepilin-type N-terminal cleavage/methylation domain-containing protein